MRDPRTFREIGRVDFSPPRRISGGPKPARRVLWGLGVGLMLLVVGSLRANEDEIRGFILDNTLSRIGHEFYRCFSERLRDTSRLEFNLVIRERPSARWGSLIWVEHEGRLLYRGFLQPNTAQLEELAYQVADRVEEEIARKKLEMLLYDSLDMDKDEL